ncbi:protein Mpv17 [Nematocida sp. AWRm77]|nr:protein Mpv17 [Nematocida sp. AWRm77]
MYTRTKYRGIIERKPANIQKELFVYLWQGAMASGVLTMSDVIGQMVVGEEFSFFSPLAMGAFGFVTGVMCYTLYQKMEVPGEKGMRPKDRVRIAFKKMLIDQLLWSPISNFIFILYISIIDAKPRSIKDVLLLYVTVLLRSYRIWPVVQMVNFLFLPIEFRVPFMCTMSLLWNIYLKIIRS